MSGHTFNSIPRKSEAGRSPALGQPGLHGEAHFETAAAQTAIFHWIVPLLSCLRTRKELRWARRLSGSYARCVLDKSYQPYQGEHQLWHVLCRLQCLWNKFMEDIRKLPWFLNWISYSLQLLAERRMLWGKISLSFFFYLYHGVLGRTDSMYLMGNIKWILTKTWGQESNSIIHTMNIVTVPQNFDMPLLRLCISLHLYHAGRPAGNH